jgi:transcriptional regulator with XRE-family HTH domain
MTTHEASALATVRGQQLARDLRERLPAEAAAIAINRLAEARQRHESWEKRFGEVVRGWRQERGWSQEDVAEKLRHQGFEMHQTTVAKIERGVRPLRIAEAAALAEVFGMPFAAVFELSLSDDHPGWAVEGQPQVIRERQALLAKARELSDRARDKLDDAAKDYAYFLAEVEKIVLRMNQQIVDEVRNGPEA